MSKYVEVFKQIREYEQSSDAEARGDIALLYGDYILVNVLQDQEIKSASGLIVSTPTNHALNSMNQNKPVFCEVLLPGQGFADDDGNSVPLDVEAGDVVVVGQNAALQFSRFGTIPMSKDLQLALIRESEIIMHFPGESQFQDYFNRLHKAINGLSSK